MEERNTVTISPYRVINKRIAQKQNVAEDSYTTKLKKYIPTDVVVMYVALASIIREIPPTKCEEWNTQENLFLGIFLIGLIFTPLYKNLEIRRDGKGTPWFQLIMSTLAYAVWVFVLGDWFEIVMYKTYSPQVAAAVAIIFSALIPLIEGYVITPTTQDDNK